MPVVFAAYGTDVIEHSWSSEDTMREDERTSRCFAARPFSSIPLRKANSYYTYTGSNLPVQCITAHLICGNRGSSDEGRDGGLCNHAVGGDAVRRGVEPEERQRERKRGSRKGVKGTEEDKATSLSNSK